MNICFLMYSHWSAAKGGAEQQAFMLADDLKKKGHEVNYICLTGANTENSYEIHQIPSKHSKSRMGYARHTSEILKILKRILPDVIYTRASPGFLHAATRYAYANKNCRVLLHLANISNVTWPRFNLKLSYLATLSDFLSYRKSLEKCDTIIGQACYQSKLLQKNFGLACDYIIPNFQAPIEKVPGKTDPIRILWVGNLKAQKQPELFVYLAEEFQNEKNTEFIIIGRANPKWNKLLARFKSLPNTRYLGELDLNEVIHQMGKGHIFVNTSILEGFPNTFILAWLNEMPVVSLVTNPDDVIEKKHLGYHSRTTKQLAADIEHLLQNPYERMAMGKNARKFAQSTYSLENLERLAGIVTSPLETTRKS